jgi:hypothetical protein
MQIPLKLSFLDAYFTGLLNPSTISINKRGERGHPYLRPLPSLKKGDATPLIKMEKET